MTATSAVPVRDSKAPGRSPLTVAAVPSPPSSSRASRAGSPQSSDVASGWCSARWSRTGVAPPLPGGRGGAAVKGLGVSPRS
ncbi:hypothetical protein JNUCC64_24525 [Streptomyces sp. JNUCC 64]